jgi:hypothetical protein
MKQVPTANMFKVSNVVELHPFPEHESRFILSTQGTSVFLAPKTFMLGKKSSLNRNPRTPQIRVVYGVQRTHDLIILIDHNPLSDFSSGLGSHPKTIEERRKKEGVTLKTGNGIFRNGR